MVRCHFILLLFLAGTNSALLKEAASVVGGEGGKLVGGVGEQGVRELLRKWSFLNNLRGGLLVVSAGIGAWTALV